MFPDKLVPETVICCAAETLLSHFEKLFTVPDTVIDGRVTVTVLVAVHPFEDVYVIMEDPEDTPVTTPVVPTVATAVLELTHGFIVAGENPVKLLLRVKGVVKPCCTVVVPNNVGASLIPEIKMFLEYTPSDKEIDLVLIPVAITLEAFAAIRT